MRYCEDACTWRLELASHTEMSTVLCAVSHVHLTLLRSLDRYVFNDVEQCSTTALFTARADGRSESLPPLDFCKACLWQVMDASIDLRDPNPN